MKKTVLVLAIATIAVVPALKRSKGYTELALNTEYFPVVGYLNITGDSGHPVAHLELPELEYGELESGRYDAYVHLKNNFRKACNSTGQFVVDNDSKYYKPGYLIYDDETGNATIHIDWAVIRELNKMEGVKKNCAIVFHNPGDLREARTMGIAGIVAGVHYTSVLCGYIAIDWPEIDASSATTKRPIPSNYVPLGYRPDLLQFSRHG